MEAERRAKEAASGFSSLRAVSKDREPRESREGREPRARERSDRTRYVGSPHVQI